MNPLVKIVMQALSHLPIIVSALSCDPSLSSLEELALSDAESQEEASQEEASQEEASQEEASQEDFGASSATPEALSAIFVAPQSEVEVALEARCEQCPSSQSCERSPEEAALTLSEASCLIAESSERELDSFIDYQRCILSATREFSVCVESAMSCDDRALESCSSRLSMSAAQCTLDPIYRDRVGIICFDERPDFVCDDGQTIEGEWVCDGEPDCADQSDEAQGCSGR